MNSKISSFYINLKQALKTKFIFSMILILISFSLLSNLIMILSKENLLSIIEITQTVSIIMIINSILIAVFILNIVLKLFWYDLKDGVHKLELRIGLSSIWIFLIRILIIILLTFTILSIQLLIGLIYYSILLKTDQAVAYKVFIAPIGWYSIICFMTIFLSMLLAIVFNSKNSPIIATAIMTIFIIWVPISGNLLNPSVSKEINNELRNTWKTEWTLNPTEYVSRSVSFENY